MSIQFFVHQLLESTYNLKQQAIQSASASFPRFLFLDLRQYMFDPFARDKLVLRLIAKATRVCLDGWASKRRSFLAVSEGILTNQRQGILRCSSHTLAPITPGPTEQEHPDHSCPLESAKVLQSPLLTCMYIEVTPQINSNHKCFQRADVRVLLGQSP